MIQQTLILLIFCSSVVTDAVQKYTLNKQSSSLEVLGTSTLHDWEIEAEEMDGTAAISLENGLDVSDLTFKVVVKSLKSGKSGMDKNTWSALEYKDHPNISYKLTNVEGVTSAGSTYKLSTTGKLTIAGTSKTVKIPVEAKVNSGQVNFNGEIDFKMTDFEVDPPTALMGTIKTGDEITIKFNVNYKNN